MLVISIVEEPCVPEQAMSGGFFTVIFGSQSTASLASISSSVIFVKSLDVKLSVIFQVIVEPSGTEAVCEVSVAPLLTDKLELAVWYDPLSILYSTL